MTRLVKHLRRIHYPFYTQKFKNTAGLCVACGETATFQYLDVINDDLANAWRITDKLRKQFSIRESMYCSNCRCSARLRALAKAITLVFDKNTKSLAESIERGLFAQKKVAEINACGDLHSILKKIKDLSYSEYVPADKSTKHENLQDLSYKSGMFDLVLTSDTLEHIPDYKTALQEINRVLKKNGYHIFTVPIIFSRNNRKRAELMKGKLHNLQVPSYHGSGEPDNLVCNEFGIDFLEDLKAANFTTDIYFANPLDKNEVNCVLVSRKD